MIRQGKGKKDRIIPIGERAIGVDREIHAQVAAGARGSTGRRHAVPDGRGRSRSAATI